MIEPEKTSAYEARLLKERDEIDRKIKSLQDERRAIERLIFDARGRDKIAYKIKRKNSVDRAVVEAQIREALTNDGPLRSSELFRRARLATYSLNDNTFRSYLHRMKERGIIENYKGRRGHWTLAGSDSGNG